MVLAVIFFGVWFMDYGKWSPTVTEHEGEAEKRYKVIVHLKTTPWYDQKSLCVDMHQLLLHVK